LPKEKTVSKEKDVIVFNCTSYDYEPMQLPCGSCIGCRLEYSRQWAIRCVHESKLYKENCFITLTYSTDKVPSNGSLDKKVFQKFMKRLRKRFSDRKIRFYHCGEYGEKRGRPHYHACIFNLDLPDKKYLKTIKGCKLYTSEILSELWGYGFASVGSLTFESAAYVARYCTKKINGKKANEIKDNGLKHYERMNEDGEIIVLSPEYSTMSRGGRGVGEGGIGKGYFDMYKRDWYPQDKLTIRGKECRPPKYYGNLYEQDNLATMKVVKERRCSLRGDWREELPERLKSREKVSRAKLSLYSKRDLE
jgi:hypothetical protein